MAPLNGQNNSLILASLICTLEILSQRCTAPQDAAANYLLIYFPQCISRL